MGRAEWVAKVGLARMHFPSLRGLRGLEKGVKNAGVDLGEWGGLQHLNDRVFFCDGFQGLGGLGISGRPEKNLEGLDS